MPQNLGLILLATLLAFGVVAWEHVIHAYVLGSDASLAGHLQHWLQDSALALPATLAAVWAGLALARRPGLTERLSWRPLPAAATVSIVFFVLMIPSVVVHQLLQGALAPAQAGVIDPLEAAGTLGAVALHGLRDGLVGQVVALPLLIIGLALLPLTRPTAVPRVGLSRSSSSSSPTWLWAPTRRNLLKAGLVGSVPLVLPAEMVGARLWGSVLGGDDELRSPAVQPFQAPLPIPQLLTPVTTDPAEIRAFLRGEKLTPGLILTRSRFNPDVPYDAQGGWAPTGSRARYREPTALFEITQRKIKQQILPGALTEVWTYNGRFPGPTIRVNRNKTTVARFSNAIGSDELSRPVFTTVHHHGGHQAPEDDGHPDDGFRPGTFRDYIYSNDSPEGAAPLWYHDHIEDFTGRNVFMGLAGFYILAPDEADQSGSNPDLAELDLLSRHLLPAGLAGDPAVPAEQAHDIPLVLQDRLFRADNSLLYTGDPDGVLGDVQLVNGAVQPFFKVATRKYRLRILNGSNARIYELALSSGQPFVQIGSDGGLLPKAVERATIRLGEAERVEVIVDFSGRLGQQVILQNLIGVGGADPRRGTGGGPAEVMRFDVVRDETDNVGTVRDGDPLRPLQPIDTTNAVTHEFRFERSGGGWVINGQAFDFTRIDAFPHLDAVEVWHLVNSSGGWSHPIHIHDLQFQVLDRDEVAPPAWEAGSKDTFLLGPGQKVRVVGKFADNFGNPYVFHCHNLEHEDMAMMSQFRVDR